MKKALSLILAALLCATTAAVVAAEEVTEVPATGVVVDEAPAAEFVLDDAGVSTETQIAPYDADSIVAFIAAIGSTITPEFVDAVFSLDVAPDLETLIALAAKYEIVLDEEQASLLLDIFGAYMIMPLTEELPAEEVAVEDVAIIEEVAEEEVVEEVVEEEVSKYPCILEELPTFGLFAKFPMPMYKYLYRG